jgi:hypothetical protein
MAGEVLSNILNNLSITGRIVQNKYSQHYETAGAWKKNN